MQIFSYLFTGILIGVGDYLFFDKNKGILSFIKKTLLQIVFLNILSLGFLKFIMKMPSVLKPSSYTGIFTIQYIVFTLFLGIIYLIIKGVSNSKIIFEPFKEENNWKNILIKILSALFFSVGVCAVFFSSWFIEFYGEMTPEQFLFNLSSPIKGTSSDITYIILMSPLFSSVVLIALFLLLVSFRYEVFVKIHDINRRVLSKKLLKLICVIVAAATFLGGSIYCIDKLHLTQVYKAYASDSTYIKDNYSDPRLVPMSFPAKKRNLVHIYLESVENSYLSKELGGYMKENLMPELTELSKEGIHFSHSNKFGGPYQTYGSSWSVASMINIDMGIPLKIAVGGNSYGKSGTFLPGTVGMGDILASQGYNQTIMFGADADFGGLTTYFTTHGKFNIFDYKAAKSKKLIPQNYNVWWGFEDDKLYEYAKDEMTRLSKTGKPFNFTMETADTHFPSGYMSKNAPKKYADQYSNVIAYSTKEAVQFIKWIQTQPFYEDTSIVVTGDHLSMDKKFFENFDKSYHRTVFNLFINSAVTADNVKNRQFSNFDMYPTILSSMGVEIKGNKLGLGTDLFSNQKTLIESDGIKKLEEELSLRSNFYNSEFVSEKRDHTFDNKLVTQKK